MSSGFYKRRRGVLEHLENGTISLLELAIHDYLCLKANGMVGTACTIPPGCCFTSSLAIHAFCPEVSERAIRRALEHLEEIGWIKRFMVRGRKGNYVAMINRFSVHDKSGNEYRVNADATTDWRNPVLEPFVDSAMKSEKSGHEVATDREVESKDLEKESGAIFENGRGNHHPRPNTPTDKTDDDDDRVNLPRTEQKNPAVPRVQRLKDSAFEKIKIKHGHRFDDAFIRERLDDFESLAPKPVISANYFVTCFENKVESESPANTEPMPNASSSATHDDLLKDRKNYGLLPWSFGYIIVRTGGSRREILSHNTAQAMTGCSVEHMAEHLRADGFWAEVYQPKKKTG